MNCQELCERVFREVYAPVLKRPPGEGGKDGPDLRCVREAVHAEGLLPDARPRHAMGAFELLRSIRSEEVKDLVRELDPNLGRGLAE